MWNVASCIFITLSVEVSNSVSIFGTIVTSASLEVGSKLVISLGLDEDYFGANIGEYVMSAKGKERVKDLSRCPT